MQIRMMPDLKLTALLLCDNMMKVSLMNYNSKSSLCFLELTGSRNNGRITSFLEY